jgi:hypothetical protein
MYDYMGHKVKEQRHTKDGRKGWTQIWAACLCETHQWMMMHASHLCIKTCRHDSLLTQSNESHLNSQCEVSLWAITWANYWHMMISRGDTDTCVFNTHWIWNTSHMRTLNKVQDKLSYWYLILVTIQFTLLLNVILSSLVGKYCTCHTGIEGWRRQDLENN